MAEDASKWEERKWELRRTCPNWKAWAIALAVVLLALGAVAAAVAVALTRPVKCAPLPGSPPATPLGTCRGSLAPGRVVWARTPDACKWDGATGFWWNGSNTDGAAVAAMLDRSLLSVAKAQNTSAAWDALFRDLNSRVYKEADRGYVAGDKIAVKINLNGFLSSYESNNANGLSPQLLRALVSSLVDVAGVPQADLFIYDGSRRFIDNLFDAVHTSYPNVHCVDSGGENGRELIEFDPASHLQFSNTKVAAWNETWLPTVVTAARYLIVVDNLRGHVYAGVTLTAKNFFGSIYRPDCSCLDAKHWCPMSLHPWIHVTQCRIPMGKYTPLVDLLGHKDLAAKSMLFLMDGLYGGWTQDPEPPVRFESAPFNGGWTCSIFASQDPLALDSVAFDFLRNEPNVPYARQGCIDNYLHEAAELPNPKSGFTYNPTGSSPLSEPLGCHEHWDSAETKQYSRNINPATGTGIELVSV